MVILNYNNMWKRFQSTEQEGASFSEFHNGHKTTQ